MNYTDISENDKDYLRLKNLHEACFKDLTGQKYGKLTVLNLDHREGKIYYWNCLCECGNHTITRTSCLTTGHTKSCGCAHKKSHLKDLTGMRFGNLTVLEYSHQEGSKHFWKCVCDCGAEIIANGRYLNKGTKTSCGCARRKIKENKRKYDLTGQRFGMLVAIEPRNHSNWFCKCDCGGTKIAKTGDLIRNKVMSCGCRSVNFCGSIPENEIRDYITSILPDSKIIKTKVLFNDDTHRYSEIDIYLPELKIGIEYNGSAFHASENTKIGENKSKYYHRDKFLQAKKQGIHLISVFDIDYEVDRDKILSTIHDILINNVAHELPTKDIIYTNNDFDDGEWLKEYGYTCIGQKEPDYFIYGRENYKVYRSGISKWVKSNLDNTEVSS